MYPLFLDLSGRRVVLVGADELVIAKAAALRRAGADLRVVRPNQFRARHLDDAWFVVAAASAGVNRKVARAAAARRIFANAVDDPPNATAYLGGVVRRGGVTVAISTNGRAPALAGLLREGLDEVLPSDLGRWSAVAARRRRVWRKSATPMAARRPDLLSALTRLYPRPS
jgi:uroporphyrin-III C-methyltransferase/precorrin-2 dehydrogenase/sirohydrochlorin ferrochelatase